MDQLTDRKKWFGKGTAGILGVLVGLVALDVGDAKASNLETKMMLGNTAQVAMLGEAVSDGELKKNRGAGLESPTLDVSSQPSGGYAVILWDESGKGKNGGGTVSLSDTTTVNVTAGGK